MASSTATIFLEDAKPDWSCQASSGWGVVTLWANHAALATLIGRPADLRNLAAALHEAADIADRADRTRHGANLDRVRHEIEQDAILEARLAVRDGNDAA